MSVYTHCTYIGKWYNTTYVDTTVLYCTDCSLSVCQLGVKQLLPGYLGELIVLIPMTQRKSENKLLYSDHKGCFPCLLWIEYFVLFNEVQSGC